MSLIPFSLALGVLSNNPDEQATNYKTSTPVTIKQNVSGNPLANIYLDEDGDTALPNPMNTDGRGVAAFYIEAGEYIAEYQDNLQLVTSKFSVSTSDHSKLVNRNAVGAHDAIYRRETTVAQVENGDFEIGSLLSLVDRSRAHFNIEPTGYYVVNGYDILSAGTGRVAVLQQDTDWRYYGGVSSQSIDSLASVNRMIVNAGGISGERGVLSISNSLPFTEGLYVKCDQNSSANTAGLIGPVDTLSAGELASFSYFDTISSGVEHISISDVRFYRGKNVIKQNNTASGFLSQANFKNVVFQEITGYSVDITNSLFVTDFENTRWISSAGVSCGHGVNVLTFRNVGFEMMHSEALKMDTSSSPLPSACVLFDTVRSESISGAGVTPSSSSLVSIDGSGITSQVAFHNFYHENSFLDIFNLKGCRGVSIDRLFVTNDLASTQTITLNNTHVSIENSTSLVPLVVNCSNGSKAFDKGGNSKSIEYRLDATSTQIATFDVKKELNSGVYSDLFSFKTDYIGGSGVTVFAACNGFLDVSVVSSKTDDGTPIYGVKRFGVSVRKVFGDANLGLTVSEVDSVGSFSDASITFDSTLATTSILNLAVRIQAATGVLGVSVVNVTFTPRSVASGLNGISVSEM